MTGQSGPSFGDDPQTTTEEIAQITAERDRLGRWVVELEERLLTANARLLGAGLPDA